MRLADVILDVVFPSHARYSLSSGDITGTGFDPGDMPISSTDLEGPIIDSGRNSDGPTQGKENSHTIASSFLNCVSTPVSMQRSWSASWAPSLLLLCHSNGISILLFLILYNN